MITPYRHDRYPPAPVLEIRLSAPGEPPHARTLTALIDTGADFTIVPLAWLLEVNAPEIRSAYARGIWSERQLVTTYLVDIHLATQALPGVEVIGLDTAGDIGVEDEYAEEVILGRNVLNLLLLLLEGPQELTTLLERRPQRL